MDLIKALSMRLQNESVIMKLLSTVQKDKLVRLIFWLITSIMERKIRRQSRESSKSGENRGRNNLARRDH